ncbi:MAG: glutathione S-transferase family protein [Aestuariivirga sp.]
MIEIFVRPSTATQRVTIMLEETGLAYRTIHVPLGSTDAALLATGSRGRTPAIIDHDAGPEPLALTQSNAILLYLAEKTGKLIPTERLARARCYEWMMMLATDIYPAYAAVYYMSWKKPEPYLDAAAWFEDRTIAEYEAFDRHLAKVEYVAGSEYSIADIAGYPPAVLGLKDLPALGRFKNLKTWMERIARRPPVQAGMAATGKGRPPELIASRSA